MERKGNSQMLRMADGIEKVAGEEAADQFAATNKLSVSADVEKRFAWAEKVCQYLSEHFSEEEIRSIRHNCICNDGHMAANSMKKAMDKAANIEEFVKLFNESVDYAYLQYENEHSILMCYPQCYCSCVKRVEKDLPKTWCYCTEGYSKSVFSQLFGKEVNAELLESIKLGNSRCAVRVTF